MGFADAVAHVLSWEGGYVDDPHDPGGRTKYGLSQRAYPDLDITALTEEAARAIYHRDYWMRMRCDALPDAVALAVFDGAVNQGPDAAARLLQRVVGVPDDGIVGELTIMAASQAPLEELLPDYLAERALRYAQTPGWERYRRGWMRRLMATAVEASRVLA